METNKENVDRINKFSGIEIFAMKVGVVLIGVFLLVIFLLPDISGLKRFETPKSKLILLSFVQNPQALLKISEIEETEGKLDNAIRETELAIGLLEMHGADKQVIKKYSDRVNKLMSKKLSIS